MTAHHHSFRQDLLHQICRRWPERPFTAGIHSETRRYCIFVYDAFEPGSSLPAVGAKEVAIELEGSSEKDVELLMTKLMMVCG